MLIVTHRREYECRNPRIFIGIWIRVNMKDLMWRLKHRRTKNDRSNWSEPRCVMLMLIRTWARQIAFGLGMSSRSCTEEQDRTAREAVKRGESKTEG